MPQSLEEIKREIEKAISILESGAIEEIFIGFGKDFYIEVDKDTALQILRERLEKVKLISSKNK